MPVTIDAAPNMPATVEYSGSTHLEKSISEDLWTIQMLTSYFNEYISLIQIPKWKELDHL